MITLAKVYAWVSVLFAVSSDRSLPFLPIVLSMGIPLPAVSSQDEYSDTSVVTLILMFTLQRESKADHTWRVHVWGYSCCGVF